MFDDSSGLEQSRTEAVGTVNQRTTSTQWNVAQRLPTLITEPGRTTAYTYDAAGNPLTVTVTDTATGVARTTTRTYNSLELLSSVTDPMGNVTSYGYDNFGELTSITNPLGQITQITAYNADGRPLSVVDANGVETDLTYDPIGRLASKSTAGATTRYTYDRMGNLTMVTLPTGVYVQYSYDQAERLVQINDNLNDTITYQLDSLGNRTGETTEDPNGNITRVTHSAYDDLNHLTQVTGGAGQMTAYAYDPLGNVTGVTDPLGNQRHQSFDSLNRLASVIDTAGGTTNYTHDPLDRVTDVTDPKNLDTHYVYDGFGDVVETDSPDTGKTTFTYDLDGNRLTKADANGNTTTYTYDALNRVTSTAYTDTSLDVTYTYDSGTDGVGRLTGIQDKSGSTAYVYDARGNTIQKSVTVEANTFVISYQYDLADELSSFTYPDGIQIKYLRDQVGRITTVLETRKNVLSAIAGGITYEPFGPITHLGFSNGLTESRSYDQDYRLTGISAPGIALGISRPFSSQARSARKARAIRKP